MRNFGAWLMIGFGALLTTGTLGQNATDVGNVISICGGNVQPLTVVTCEVGTLTVDKVVVGTPPAAPWTVTIGSTDCASGLVGRMDLVQSIPAAGGSVSVTELFVHTDSNATTFCHYTVTESPVAGWTPTYSPVGPVTLIPNGVTTVEITNTEDSPETTMAPTTTTIAPTTTTIASTTTTISASTTSASPTTVAPSTTINSIAPTTTIAATSTTTAATVTAIVTTTDAGSGANAPADVILPTTGTDSSGTQTYIGFGLIGLGAVMLITRRRARSQSAS